MSSASILVTGLSGFTGQHLLPLLQSEDHRVIGLGGLKMQGVAHVPRDLTNAVAVRNSITEIQPTHVAHLAACSFVGHNDMRTFYEVNVLGTENLLQALAQLPQKPRRILIASSANIYGNPRVEQIEETLCPAPVNHYAYSKLTMEHMARTCFDQLPIVLVRPFNYTGVGQSKKFLIPKIVSHFRQKKAYIDLGNLEVSRDFSDVRDVARCYQTLLLDSHGVEGKTFNICTGRVYNLQEIIQLAMKISKHSLEVRFNPAFVRKNEISVLRGSPEKLYQATGLSLQIPMEETLRWMLHESPGEAAR